MQPFAINAAVTVPTTPAIVFLKGGVSLWSYSISFFTTNVSLAFAAENFKLFEELPQADTGTWTLEELFQRDISWERVDQELLGYLRNQGRPQFFNALTVALLPSGAESFGAGYGPDVECQPLTEPGLGKPLRVGGIQIQFYGSDEDVTAGAGKMLWSTRDVDAVAVDGQHRLAAIKKFVSEERRERWETASVPVIFLIADDRVGFRTPHGAGERNRTVSALRNVFIDLNKNARPVSPSRTILLNDLDLVSVATRNLIGRSLGDNHDDNRLPLALVDWMTDRNQIDKGPFVTTVTLLNEAIGGLLQIPDPQMDIEDNSVSKVETWIKSVLPPETPGALDDVMSQVRRCAELQTRLSWLPMHVRTLEEAFASEWRPHLRSLFRNFAPYDALWSLMERKGVLTPEFINLYVAQEIMHPTPGQARAKRLIAAAKQREPGWTLERNYERPMTEIGAIKSGEWAYKVVFQRALMRTLCEVLKAPSRYLADPSAGKVAATAAVVGAANVLAASGLLKEDARIARAVPFWQGIGKTPDDRIEFTNAGAERIKAWLQVFLILHQTRGKMPRFAELEDANARPDTRPAQELASLLAANARRIIFKGMAKLVAARGEDPGDATQVMEHVRPRYEHLRKLAQGS